jgi:glycosyltransferase involved in cell wall biosynthesis
VTRVAFDVGVLAEREPTGVARAAEELLRALAAAPEEFELVLVAPDAVPERARAAAPGASAHGLRGGFPARLWREFAAPRWVRREGIALWHAPVTAFPFLARCARVATVHELALAEPGFGARDGEGALAQRARLWLAARAATRVLCVSETTRARFAARFPHAAPRARCVAHGVSAAFAGAEALSPARRELLVGGKEPYVLVLGTRREKKDPLAALAAFETARIRLGRSLRLVFAGPPGTHAEELARAIASRGFAEHVRIAGYVDDAELPGLLSGARALLFLSRSEGCGLPILEAQAAGVPVVAAGIEALRETSGGAALFAAPGDAAGAAAALIALEEQPALRGELVARGRANAATRTWAGTAAAVRELWRDALRSAGP